MNCSEALRVAPGITAMVGSGGKSTALSLFARELTGTVVLATTTHFVPERRGHVLLDPTSDEVADAVARHRVVWVGSPAEGRKLGPCSLSPAELAGIADYVLVEADGSRRLPLKAHADHEPVIPEGTGQTILVVGADGFDRPCHKVAHRPELFCELAGIGMRDKVTPEAVARVVLAESDQTHLDAVLVNQVDTVLDRVQAILFADAYGRRCYAGSLRSRQVEELVP